MQDYKKQMEWQKKNTVVVNIRLNKGTDADIIKRLEEVPSRAGYIRSLIRRDMEIRGIEYEHIGKRKQKQYEKYLEELENGNTDVDFGG